MRTITILFFSLILTMLSGRRPVFQPGTSSEKIRLIFDTDANNELDDQHALAYLLFNGNTFDVAGVTVNRTSGGGDITAHYEEAERIIKLCNLEGKIPLYKGASGDFSAIRATLDSASFDGSDAVNFIIDQATSAGDPRLVILATGKLTNVALALEKEPRIADKIKIVWLGSNYPEQGEYNLENDTMAMNYILSTPVDFDMVTVRYGKETGTDFVRVTRQEIGQNMPGRGPVIAEPVMGRHNEVFVTFGDYSVNLFNHADYYGDPPSRALFDMAAVAILKNSDWAKHRQIPCPVYTREGWIEQPANKRMITIWEYFERDSITHDFFRTMKNYKLVASEEAKVPEYKLPEMLISNNGKKIQTPEDWINIRRPEIIQLFEEYVYGRFPGTCLEIKFETVKIDSNAICGRAIQKNIVACFIKEGETVQMELLIFIPANATKPVPLFLGMNFYGNQSILPDSGIPITKSYVLNNTEYNIFNHTATNESRGTDSSSWPVERILERGYGLATFCYGDLDPDFDDGFKNGIHSLSDYSEKNDSIELSSISAWTYGLTTAMDYFETDEQINKSQIIVIGHSRLGKTALWAGAIDQRFAIVISNNSGCGGAALSRRIAGETVKDINTMFPHWFCKNFHDFNDKENELPVDQHMLIGLIAPRPVYVGSAEQDKWADPYGEFLSIYHAGPAYKLFGYEIIENDTLPEINKPLWRGKMGYHIRTGDHGITRFDWEKYMDFADYHFNRKDK